MIWLVLSIAIQVALLAAYMVHLALGNFGKAAAYMFLCFAMSAPSALAACGVDPICQ